MMLQSYYGLPNVEAQLYPNYDAALRDGLAGFEENLKRVFAAIPGASGAYGDLVSLIQQKAREGAEAAIPRIKREVESTVKPFVIAAMLLGFGGFLFGISTYMMARRSSPVSGSRRAR